MKFCPECGSLMLPKKERKKNIVKCSCGYKESLEESIKISDKKKEDNKKEMEIVDDEKENLPECDEECPECKNKKSYYWIVQTRSADEPPTKFMKCTNCKYTWRDYD